MLTPEQQKLIDFTNDLRSYLKNYNTNAVDELTGLGVLYAEKLLNMNIPKQEAIHVFTKTLDVIYRLEDNMIQ